MNNFDAVFADFLEGVQALVNESFKHYPSLTPPTVKAEVGRRYIRILTDGGPKGQRMAWGFVDKTNGDILKAAGWKAPAKHARGNIFNANPYEGVSAYGPAYLR